MTTGFVWAEWEGGGGGGVPPWCRSILVSRYRGKCGKCGICRADGDTLKVISVNL